MPDPDARRRRTEARARRRGESDSPGADDGQQHAGDAARAAASAALAAAAVGAAQALARRRHPDEDDPPAEPAGREPEDAAGDAAPEEREPEPEPGRDGEPSRPSGDAVALIDRAREQLRGLRGAEAEAVSSISRTADGWRIGLEVVEVRRIPESTDVLATYEVELDPDGSLLGFERTGRYYRSEVERR
jgi:hypothetical protein